MNPSAARNACYSCSGVAKVLFSRGSKNSIQDWNRRDQSVVEGLDFRPRRRIADGSRSVGDGRLGGPGPLGGGRRAVVADLGSRTRADGDLLRVGSRVAPHCASATFQIR